MNNTFGHTVVAAAVAAVVGGGIIFGINSRPPPAQITKLVRPSSPNVWDELEQSQVDALTAALGKLKKRDVAIFCLRGCGDLALSFDNAFESAKWNSAIETPLTDDTVGLSIGPADDPDAKAIGAAIASTTGLMPKLVEAHIVQGRIVLVIGRKSRA